MGRRKPQPSRGQPSFFKIMFGDFSQKLKIPPAFVKHFDGALPEKFALRSNAKRVRHVHVKKVKNNSFFTEGWGLFVQDNSLESGDFLVFWYAGDSKFDVVIFGKNGCEKEAPAATRKSNEVICIDSDCTSDETGLSRPQDQFRSMGFQPLQRNSKIEHDNFQELIVEERAASQVTPVTRQSSCSGVPTVMQRNTRALEAARKFISKHPFFTVSITKSYLHHRNLNVPQSFVKMYIKEASQTVTLRVLNRSWPVKLIIYSKYTGKFSAGWGAFVRDNNMRRGDVCIFELIKRDDIVLKVTIFRSGV